MGDWYRVIKTIKGNRYVYRQWTWREGTRVRTESQYLGREGGGGYEPALPLEPRPAKRLTADEAEMAWEEGELTSLRPHDLAAKFRSAMRDYTEEGHEAVNSAMRGWSEPTSSSRNKALMLKKYVYHSRLKHNVTLYRAAAVRTDLAAIGKRFTDNAFISFTVSRRIHGIS